ncbi:MAG: GumC family protein [Inhella sp.]
MNLIDLAAIVIRRWRLVVGGSLLIGAIALGASFLITPVFTARTTFIPPQSGGSMISSALASLGPFSGLAGGAGTSGRSGETYVALLRSRTLGERLVEKHKLKELYKARFSFEALDALNNRTRIEYSKKDGIIAIEFDDVDPERAALIANDYVDQLKAMNGSMTLTDAQRRRAFFEAQLDASRKKLATAQAALQGTGFDQSALHSEPRAAAEEYARIKAELTATDVRLSELRSRLANRAPEVQSLAATASALQRQLALLEQRNAPTQSQDYVGRYREFKYHESLYEQLAKQFEAARLEESREDNMVQVIDKATAPEWKSKPKRASIGVAAALIAALLLSATAIVQQLRKLTHPNSAPR